MQSQASVMSHPRVDISSADEHTSASFYHALAAIPHLSRGGSGGDPAASSREAFIKQYQEYAKQWEPREGADPPGGSTDSPALRIVDLSGKKKSPPIE